LPWPRPTTFLGRHLVSATKPNDVYAIHLDYGVEVVITCQSGVPYHKYHAHLLTPDSQSILNGRYEQLAETQSGKDVPGQIFYTPAVDGTYYLWLSADTVGVTYTVMIGGSAETPPYPTFLRLRSSAASLKKGRSVTLSATLVDQASKLVGGASVSLQSSVDGKNWKTVKSLSSGSGKYAAVVKVARSTWFRMTFAGDADHGACVSRKLLVKAK
jgi:hypothetical protein